jgi:hypothetical protein
VEEFDEDAALSALESHAESMNPEDCDSDPDAEYDNWRDEQDENSCRDDYDE